MIEKLSKIGIWGWPWHGLVSQADEFTEPVVTLPNATTRPHPLPANPGNSYRIKMPGIAAVSRSSDQLAADAAAGMEWRNEQLLCGSTFQLYGKDLGGWVYFAGDGSRWIINLLDESAKLLGEFNVASRVEVITINLPSDDGQGTPAVEFGGSPAYVRRWPTPCDISPDGSSAILMLYATDPDWAVGARPIPLGFLLAEVSGSKADAFVIDVTVLRTRAETLGTTSYENEQVITYDPVEGWAVTVTGTTTRGINDRIWAMWFNESELPIECAIDLLEEYQQEGTAGVSVYARGRKKHTIKVNDIDVESADIQSETTTTATTYSATGTLNGETIFSDSASGGSYDPPIADILGPFDDISYQVMRRSDMGSVGVGDVPDVMVFSNNLIGLYVRLLFTGSTDPEHRYIGAATPSGAVTLNGSEEAAVAVGIDRAALYGPTTFSAYNPTTEAVADLSALPVGWI